MKKNVLMYDLSKKLDLRTTMASLTSPQGINFGAADVVGRDLVRRGVGAARVNPGVKVTRSQFAERSPE